MPAELEYAKKELGVQDVYSDYREMLEKADIDAVAIVTTSGEHCWQIAAALDAGKHVFSDKPLGVTVEECKLAEEAVERHPELAFSWDLCAALTHPMRMQRRKSRRAQSELLTW